jgi:hypothetical protein
MKLDKGGEGAGHSVMLFVFIEYSMSLVCAMSDPPFGFQGWTIMLVKWDQETLFGIY